MMTWSLQQNICEFLKYCFEYIGDLIDEENKIMTAVIK